MLLLPFQTFHLDKILRFKSIFKLEKALIATIFRFRAHFSLDSCRLKGNGPTYIVNHTQKRKLKFVSSIIHIANLKITIPLFQMGKHPFPLVSNPAVSFVPAFLTPRERTVPVTSVQNPKIGRASCRERV